MTDPPPSPPNGAFRHRWAPEQPDRSAERVRLSAEIENLFEHYEFHVRRVLAGMLGPDAELSDLVQDVFVSALSSISHLREPTALKQWLSSITIYRARARIRERSRSRRLDPLPEEELGALGVVLPTPELDEVLHTAERVLSTLKADDRRAFVLRFINELELTDVARVFGVSLSTIKRRVHRATSRFDRLARREPALSDWRDGDRSFKKRLGAEA